MINFDDYANENKHSIIPSGHIFQIIILIIRGSASGNINALLNLINNQPDIDKIYLYAKDPYEAKYQFLINKRESFRLKHFHILKHLLSIQMICKIFTKILMNTIQIKNAKC